MLLTGTRIQRKNYRYQYLASKGFRYFCNVDASKPAWIQKGPDYLRMARRNLDGYRLYEDMIQEDPAKNAFKRSV